MSDPRIFEQEMREAIRRSLIDARPKVPSDPRVNPSTEPLPLEQILALSTKENAQMRGDLSAARDDLRELQRENDDLKVCLSQAENRIQDLLDEKFELERYLADADAGACARVEELERELREAQMNLRLSCARLKYMEMESLKTLDGMSQKAEATMKEAQDINLVLTMNNQKLKSDLEAKDKALAELRVECARPFFVRHEKCFMMLVFLVTVMTAIIAKQF